MTCFSKCFGQDFKNRFINNFGPEFIRSMINAEIIYIFKFILYNSSGRKLHGMHLKFGNLHTCTEKVIILWYILCKYYLGGPTLEWTDCLDSLRLWCNTMYFKILNCKTSEYREKGERKWDLFVTSEINVVDWKMVPQRYEVLILRIYKCYLR